MFKRLSLCILCLFAQPAFSESYSNYGAITEFTVGVDWARVKTDGMLAAEGCSNQSWYVLSLASGQGKEMYAALLAARLSGQRVRFQLIGCSSGSPQITHIYM